MREVDFEEVGKTDQKYYDHCMGLELDSSGVWAARQEELNVVRAKTRARSVSGGTIATWAKRPVLRSMMVVHEMRRTRMMETEDIAAMTSSTPPLETVRLFCSLMVSI